MVRIMVRIIQPAFVNIIRSGIEEHILNYVCMCNLIRLGSLLMPHLKGNNGEGEVIPWCHM